MTKCNQDHVYILHRVSLNHRYRENQVYNPFEGGARYIQLTQHVLVSSAANKHYLNLYHTYSAIMALHQTQDIVVALSILRLFMRQHISNNLQKKCVRMHQRMELWSIFIIATERTPTGSLISSRYWLRRVRLRKVPVCTAMQRRVGVKKSAAQARDFRTCFVRCVPRADFLWDLRVLRGVRPDDCTLKLF